MTPPIGFGMIVERGPVGQKPTIVDKEHVTRPQSEFHLKLWIAHRTVEDFQGLLLPRRQRLSGFLVASLDPVTQVAAHQISTIPMKNRDLDRGRVSRSEPAPAIDAERLVKRSQYFGVPGEQLVVQRI